MIILTFKDSKGKSKITFPFENLTNLFKVYDRFDLGVSKPTLDRYDLKQNVYENRLVKIEY